MMKSVKMLRRWISINSLPGWLILLLLSIMINPGCTTIDPVTSERVFNLYSIEEEVQLGKAVLEKNSAVMMQKGNRINDDSAMLANIEALVDRIAAVSEMPDLPYTVVLYDADDIVNASAAPGGAIMVYSGLYEPEKGLVQTNSELAAVLAHEIAHVNSRHVTEELSKTRSLSMAGNVVSFGLGLLGGSLASDAFNIAFSVGTGIWSPAYSRKQEKEADRISLTYLARAGIDPATALRIWNRAAQQEGGGQASIFSSHPSDQERFELLKEQLPQARAIYETVRQGQNFAPLAPLPRRENVVLPMPSAPL